MPYCAKCGEEFPEGTRFCPRCGARIKVPSRVKPMEAKPRLSVMAAEARHNELLGFGALALGLLIALTGVLVATTTERVTEERWSPEVGYYIVEYHPYAGFIKLLFVFGGLFVLIGAPLAIYYTWKHQKIMEQIKG